MCGITVVVHNRVIPCTIQNFLGFMREHINCRHKKERKQIKEEQGGGVEDG